MEIFYVFYVLIVVWSFGICICEDSSNHTLQVDAFLYVNYISIKVKFFLKDDKFLKKKNTDIILWGKYQVTNMEGVNLTAMLA